MWTSWKTTLCGGIALLCGANELIDALPPKAAVILRGVCGVAIGLGLIAARDNQVTSEQAGAK